MAFAESLPQPKCSPYDYVCIKEHGSQPNTDAFKKLEGQNKMDDLQRQRQEIIRQTPYQPTPPKQSNPYRQ